MQGCFSSQIEIKPLAPMAQGVICPKAAKLLLGVMHSVLRLGCPPKAGNSTLTPREVFFATYMAQATLSCPSDNSPCAAAKNRFQLFSRHGRETLRGFSFRNKTPCACGTRGFVYNLVESFAILSGSFRLLTTLHTGAFVMLTLTDLCQNTGLNAATLKAFQSAIQRFIFSYTDFSHLFSLPSNMPRESVTRA